MAFYLNDYCFCGVITLQLNVVIRENKSNYNNNSEKNNRKGLRKISGQILYRNETIFLKLDYEDNQYNGVALSVFFSGVIFVLLHK